MARRVDEEFAAMCDDDSLQLEMTDEGIDFRGRVTVEEILINYNKSKEGITAIQEVKRLFNAKPGRKPGKRKKNKTGWPMSKIRRFKRDNATDGVDSLSGKSEENEEVANDRIKDGGVVANNSENNNDQRTDCDSADRVKCEEKTEDKVLTNKVNNGEDFKVGLQFQPFVRVQKLDKNHIDKKRKTNPPKRINRGRRRRMPASPKSPRILRRPRGRWYRER